VRPEPFGWYQFDSFANVSHFEKLIPGGLKTLVELAGDEPMADIGTGDGDMAFLFESLGLRVTAMDWPGVNENRMEGVRLMAREVGSSIEIREVEIDDQFRLDGERYGLTLALGLLYHLKNPFYFLERLGWHSRYCVLSTVILPSRGKEPIARLTKEGEFHNDATNFWFFSESGLERLADRCGWDIRNRMRSRDRMFFFMESRTAKNLPVIRLLEGWHGVENGAWRWTAREFWAVIENTEGATRFELRFTLPAGRRVTIEAEMNGIRLATREFRNAGEHIYSEAIAAAGKRNAIRVRVGGEPLYDGRELGIVVKLPRRTIIDEDCGLRLLLVA
jgi:hypothetical protein